jgi:hypothetical protein
MIPLAHEEKLPQGKEKNANYKCVGGCGQKKSSTGIKKNA